VGFPLQVTLTQGDILPGENIGIKITAFLENADGTMVSNGRHDITDISDTVMLPYHQDAASVTALIMNCYKENRAVGVTVSAGPYIETLTPNPADPGEKIFIKGLSFGANQGDSRVFFGEDPVSEINSWNNTGIEFTLPGTVESGPVKVVVNGTGSNEVPLEIRPPDPNSFKFTSAWSKSHFPSGWGIEPDTIDFEVTGRGRILNAINPVITVNHYYNSHNIYVKGTNMRRNEVVTVEGTITVTLSTFTVSPTTGSIPQSQFVYTYSNPRLILKKDGVLIEELPDMSFSWVFDAEQAYNNDIDLYVLYDIETEYYRRETEGGPLILQPGYPSKSTSELFHLGIDLWKELPNYANP
jgi:hypothetical protein